LATETGQIQHSVLAWPTWPARCGSFRCWSSPWAARRPACMWSPRNKLV